MNWPPPSPEILEAIIAFEAEPHARYRCRCGRETTSPDEWSAHRWCPDSPLGRS